MRYQKPIAFFSSLVVIILVMGLILNPYPTVSFRIGNSDQIAKVQAAINDKLAPSGKSTVIFPVLCYIKSDTTVKKGDLLRTASASPFLGSSNGIRPVQTFNFFDYQTFDLVDTSGVPAIVDSFSTTLKGRCDPSGNDNSLAMTVFPSTITLTVYATQNDGKQKVVYQDKSIIKQTRLQWNHEETFLTFIIPANTIMENMAQGEYKSTYTILLSGKIFIAWELTPQSKYVMNVNNDNLPTYVTALVRNVATPTTPPEGEKIICQAGFIKKDLGCVPVDEEVPGEQIPTGGGNCKPDEELVNNVCTPIIQKLPTPPVRNPEGELFNWFPIEEFILCLSAGDFTCLGNQAFWGIWAVIVLFVVTAILIPSRTARRMTLSAA